MPPVRVTQESVEVVVIPKPPVRVTQNSVEVIVGSESYPYVFKATVWTVGSIAIG